MSKTIAKTNHSAENKTTRAVAWEVLRAVQAGQAWAEDLLPGRIQEAALSEADSRLARELVFGVIKSQAYLDYALAPLIKQPPAEALRQLLRLGAYQILLLDRIPDHAAVHETVELAKPGLEARQVKFVNAVLRELIRRGKPALPDPATDPVRAAAVRHSLPEFLVRRWQTRFGIEAAEAMMAAANEAPPLAARVNLEQLQRDPALAQLRAAGVEAEPGDVPSAVLLKNAKDPAQLPGYAEGWLYFQDQASQMVGYLTDPSLRHTCLDFCSAPGGKTTHLAELVGPRGTVWAYDASRRKLDMVEENARRLRLDHVKVLREMPPPAELQADRVVVDAPCSGLGTLRRHAEVRWRVTEPDLKRLAKMQREILHQAAAYVKTGGHLVYSTCTTEPEENEQVVRAFLSAHTDFELLPGPGRKGIPAKAFWGEDGFFRTFPGHPNLDSMFAARMVRKEQLSFRF